MIFFSIREAWRNFGNFGLIGLLSLASLTVTLTLAGLAAEGFFLIREVKEGLLGRFEIEAFLIEDTDSLTAMAISMHIKTMPYVDEISYISKATAALRFKRQFGEDLSELLDYNPLPPSLVVSLKRDADPSKSWRETATFIAKLPGVEDVVYEGELLTSLERFYRTAGGGVAAVVGATLFVSLLFTMLSVQNSIQSHEEFIRIIALSGGTNGMARGPFITLGAFNGIISGIVASGIIAGLSGIIRFGWGVGMKIPLFWVPALMMLGAVIGMTGAGWAAGRKIKGL